MPIQRQELTNLPASKVISIEKGEGLVSKSQQGAKDEVPLSEDVPRLVESVENMENYDLQVDSGEPYKPDEVVRLCDGINRQNRLAKVS
jgi:hypothetical protein